MGKATTPRAQVHNGTRSFRPPPKRAPSRSTSPLDTSLAQLPDISSPTEFPADLSKIPPPLPPPLPHSMVTDWDPQAAPWVYIAPSSIPGAGLGLFALCPIPTHTVIGEYKGRPYLTLQTLQSPQYHTHYGFYSKRLLAIRDAQDHQSCAAPVGKRPAALSSRKKFEGNILAGERQL